MIAKRNIHSENQCVSFMCNIEISSSFVFRIPEDILVKELTMLPLGTAVSTHCSN
jgi:hypothetical protein